MNDNQINDLLDQLKSKVLAEYYVPKEEFLNFRKVLVKREDFKHFRGIAQRGGGVLYHFLETPRS